jgi:signal transduction histidine kinase
VLRETLRRRDIQLAVLEAVALRIQAAEEEPEILNIALEEIVKRMDVTATWVFLADHKSRQLSMAASIGVSPAYLERIDARGLDPCLCPEVFASGETKQPRNTLECPRMPQLIDGLDAPVAHACIPLRFRGQSEGVLNVAAPPGTVFGDDELRFLETLGRQICLALERTRHSVEQRRLTQQAQAMVTISKTIGGTLDTQKVLGAVSEAASRLLGSEQVYVFLGSDPRDVTVAYCAGPADFQEGQRLDLEELGWPLACRALAKRQAIRLDNRTNDPRVNQVVADRLRIGSALLTPLIAHEKVLGLIVLAREAPHPWTTEQRNIADALALQAAVTLENANLYQDTRDAFDELRNAQARIIISEKMAVLGTFASGLAHEVRNPLNSIALQLSLLERRIARMEPAAATQFEELIRIIREEVQRLDGLVGDFLQFARTTQVRHELADARVLADEVVRLMAPEASAVGVTLERAQSSDAPPRIPMDSERIKQVLINLIRNAVEALPPGGVVRVSDGVRSAGASLRVTDNGPGLPSNLDVFQLFVTTKPKGTGLGLPIAQQIVDEHGGEITVESSADSGTTFDVWLPHPDSAARPTRVPQNLED